MSGGSEKTSGALSFFGQGYIALLGAILALVLLMFMFWQASILYEDNLILNKKAEVDAQLFSSGNTLENHINVIYSHLDGLDAFVRANPTQQDMDEHFQAFAFGLYSGSASLRSIEIYPDFSKSYVYPLESNEIVANRTLDDLINDERPQVRADVLKAIQEQHAVITGPYEMQRGGLGIVVRQPVYINDSLWGIVSMVVDVPPLLQESGLMVGNDNIDVALRDESGQLLFGSDETFKMGPEIYPVVLSDNTWELAAVPKDGWENSVADTLLVFQKGGFIIVILLTLLVYLLLSYSVSLRYKVENRTASLKESESRYRQLFDNNSDSLFLIDENGRILDANKVAENLYGYDRRQLLNMETNDLSPFHLRGTNYPLKNIMDNGRQFQWTHVRRNGSEFPVGINASPIVLDGKKYILASVRDITENKKIENALIESEKKYRLLTDTARDMIIVHDLQGKMLFANKVAVEFSGYSEKELLSRNVISFVSPDEREKMYQRRDHRIDNDKDTFLYETKFINKKGVEIPVEVSSVPMEDKDIMPGILIVARDITERKIAQSALIKSEEMFSTVFNTVPDSIMLTSFEGTIINVNASFLKNKGYLMDELLGSLICDLAIWSHPDICKQYINQLIFNGIVRNFETDIHTKYGETHSVIISGDIITTDSEKYVLTVFRNVTELKDTANELMKSKFLLDEVSEIASIGGWSLDVPSGEIIWTPEVFKIHDMDQGGTIHVSQGIDYYAPGSKEIISKAVQDAIEKEQPYDLELEIITAKGNHKWVRASGRPIVVDNKVTKMIGSFQDITDRKLSEFELLKQDRLLEEMGDVAKIGGWEFDVLSGTSTWTREVAIIHGLDPDAGANVYMSLEYYPPQSREIISKAFQNAIEKGESYDHELEFISVDGVHKWVRTGGQPVFEDGKIVKVVGFLQDITHLKKVEFELQRERVLLDEVGEIASIGGWEFDVVTGEGTWTPEVARIHGVDPDNPTNEDFGLSFFVPESKERIKAAIQNAIDNAEPYDLELELISADGVNKWVRTIGRPVLEDGKVVKLTGSMQDITERKIAADKLSESEERFRATFEQAAVGMFQADTDVFLIRVNQRFCEITGYNYEELIQMNFADLTYPEDLDKELALVEELASGKRKDYSIEKRYVRKDGNLIWVNVTVAIVKSSDGKPQYFIGMIEDIDSRKQAEAEIKLKSNALENSLNGFDIVSSEGKFVYANKAYLKMWGYDDINEILGTSPVGHCNDPEVPVEIISNLKEKGEYAIEFTALRKDGSTFEVLMYAQLFEDIQGNEIYMGSSVDITDRKRAEEEILRYNERLNMLHNIDTKIISSVSSKQIANEVLNHLRKLVPCSVASLRVVDPDTNEEVVFAVDSEHESQFTIGSRTSLDTLPNLDKLKAGQSVIISGLNKYNTSDSELAKTFSEEDIHSGFVVPLIIEGELMGVLSLSSNEPDFFSEEYRKIVEEVTNQLAIAIHHSRLNDQIRQYADELEVRVNERTAQLQAANKELEAFTYSVSHDLRAPLRAIDGFSRIISEDYEELFDDEGKRLFNVIRTNTQKMDKLITDLLGLSRVGRNKMNCALISMKAMVYSVYNDLKVNEIDRDIEFNVSELLNSYADPSLIKQIWVNLLSNAFKYSSSKDRGVIEVGSYIKDGMNVYYVKDNGVGFDPKYSHKLFGIFQRLHSEKEFPGTGVGLAIVQRIARRHGGDVWAEGEPEKGAKFYFSLPIKEGDDLCGE